MSTQSPLRVVVALAIEPRLGIRRRLVRLVAAFLAVEVHRRVARIVGRRAVLRALLLEALERRPRFDQRAVDGEVFGRHQAALLRDRDHTFEEEPRHVGLEHSLLVLREARRVEALLVEVHVEEEAEQQVVVEPLAELSLATHREERDQQASLQ